jgi:hypothetical protein
LKRLPVAALRGSMILYYNLGPKKTESKVPTAIDEEKDDPRKLNLQNDLHTEVLKEVNNDDVEEGEVDNNTEVDIQVNEVIDEAQDDVNLYKEQLSDEEDPDFNFDETS